MCVEGMHGGGMTCLFTRKNQSWPIPRTTIPPPTIPSPTAIIILAAVLIIRRRKRNPSPAPHPVPPRTDSLDSTTPTVPETPTIPDTPTTPCVFGTTEQFASEQRGALGPSRFAPLWQGGGKETGADVKADVGEDVGQGDGVCPKGEEVGSESDMSMESNPRP